MWSFLFFLILTIYELLFIITLFFWNFIRGIGYSFYYFGKFFFSDKKYSITLAVLIVILSLGIGLTYVQSEAQSLADIVYECGIYPGIQLWQSFQYTIIRVPYEYVVAKWNDVMLYLRDCFFTFIDEVFLITDFGTIEGIVDFLNALYKEIVCWATFPINVPSLSIEWFTEALRDLYESIFCFTDFMYELVIRIMTFTLVNSDTQFCQYDPTQKCVLRKNVVLFSVVFPPSTCPTEPFDLVDRFYGCVAKFIILFIPKEEVEIRAKVVQIFGDIACVVNSVIKPFFWIFTGLIDTLAGGDCVQFDDLLSGDELLLDAFNGIIDCLNKLITDITGGAITDFFEMIIAYFFEFVQLVVTTFEGMVNCHDSQLVAECFERWPYVNLVTDPGIGHCSFDSTVTPTGGIFECFGLIGTCLANETNVPLLSGGFIQTIIQFIYNDVPLGLDFVVCPFAALDTCFPSPGTCSKTPNDIVDLNQPICDWTCVKTTIPLLSPIAEAVLVVLETIDDAFDAIEAAFEDVYIAINAVAAFFQSQIDAITAVFVCLGKCDTAGEFLGLDWAGCFDSNPSTGCSKRSIIDEEKINVNQEKTKLLSNHSIDPNTFCGSWLYEFDQNKINNTWVNKMAYSVCFRLFVTVVVLKRSCPDIPNLQNNLLGGYELISTANSIFECVKSNSNIYVEQEKKKRGENFEEQQRNETENVIKMVNETKGHVYKIIKSITNYFSAKKSNTSSTSQFKETIKYLWENLQNSSYMALTRKYMYETRLATSSYDDILYSIENDKSKSESQRFAETKELELIQNKVLKRMFDEYLSQLNQLRKMKKKGLIIENQNINDNSTMMMTTTMMTRSYAPVSLRNEKNELITLDLNNHHLIENLSKPSNGQFRKRTFIEEKKLEAFELKKKEIKKRSEQSIERILEQTPKMVKMYHKMQKRGYDLHSNKLFRIVHMLATIAENGTYSDLFKYITGDKGYIVEKGFVSPLEEKEFLKDKRSVPRGSMIDLIFGNYSSKDAKKYGPLLVDHHFFFHAKHFPSIEKVASLMKRTQYNRRIKTDMIKKNLNGIRRSHAQNSDLEFNFNEIVYDFLDKVWSFFGSSSDTAFTSFVDDAIAVATDFFANLQEWVDNGTDNVEIYFTCNIPANINGSEFYNPFCFPLLPEALYSDALVLPKDAKTLVPQIGWPKELIERDCVNTYNGNGDIFSFEFSDNCPIACTLDSRPSDPLFFESENECLTSPDTCCRPFCTDPVPCDYCSRDYLTCIDAGFEDALDTFLFFWAAVAHLTVDLFQGGITIKSLDTILVGIICIWTGVLFLTAVITAVIVIIPTLGVGVPIAFVPYALITFVVFALEKLVIWTLFNIYDVDGVLPWALLIFTIFVGLIIITTFLGFDIIPNTIYVILSVYIFIWLLIFVLELFVGPVNLENIIDPIGWLITLFTTIQDSWFLSIFFPWADYMIARLQEFVYPQNSPLPPLDVFCFFVTFQNISLLLLIIFFSPLFIGFFGAIFYAGLVFVGAFILWILHIFRNWKVYQLGKTVNGNTKDLDSLKQEFANIRLNAKKINTKIFGPEPEIGIQIFENEKKIPKQKSITPVKTPLFQIEYPNPFDILSGSNSKSKSKNFQKKDE